MTSVINLYWTIKINKGTKLNTHDPNKTNMMLHEIITDHNGYYIYWQISPDELLFHKTNIISSSF
jgi:hypothetical protein